MNDPDTCEHDWQHHNQPIPMLRATGWKCLDCGAGTLKDPGDYQGCNGCGQMWRGEPEPCPYCGAERPTAYAPDSAMWQRLSITMDDSTRRWLNDYAVIDPKPMFGGIAT